MNLDTKIEMFKEQIIKNKQDTLTTKLQDCTIKLNTEDIQKWRLSEHNQSSNEELDKQ